ncbi:MAG: hypothetical protein J0L92_07855 [Deltaproteobacteria bacterium]|nr:hypothetical protein [Deltaproteobacteria bacterium]
MNTRTSLFVILLASLSGCGGGTVVEDAGLDAPIESLDAASLVDAAPAVDAVSAPDDAPRALDGDLASDAPSGSDSGTILPTYDGGDPFDDDGGLGAPAWVELDVITDGSACPPLDACGGDVEGTWDVTGGCFELPIEDDLSRCPGAAVTRREGRARGRVTFDGAFARRVAQSEVVVELFVPSLCADFVGGCDAIEDLVRMATVDSECVTEASGNCRCAARQVYAIDDADGYTLESNQIVSATLGRRWDYCIDGTSLRYEDVTPGSTMREPGIIELGSR